MPIENLQKMPIPLSERKSVHGKDIFSIHQSAVKRMLSEEDKITEKIIGKYILLQIGGKRRFFKIVKVNKRGKECRIGKINDSRGWDARLFGVINEEDQNIPVFDFRTKNRLGIDDNKSEQFVRIEIEGYGINQEISVLFKDIAEILEIFWQ